MAKTPVEQYLTNQPAAQREKLEQLQSLILATSPSIETKIAWGMPIYMFLGDLVGIAGFKNHVSMFPMGGGLLDELGAEADKYRTSKGTLQFDLVKPLPTAFIKKVLKLRIAQNLERANRAPQKDGLNHGKAREYYKDGTLKAEGAWRKGLLEGEWKWYRQDGSLMRSGFFKAGNQVGTWCTFARDGQLVKSTDFGK